MLLGSSSQSTPHYSLSIVRRILDIAPRFIDMRKQEIFTRTGTSAVSALLAILLDDSIYLQGDPTSNIQLIIAKHREGMEEAKKKSLSLKDSLESVRAQQPTSSYRELVRQLEEEVYELDSKCYPIDDYDWAVLCKLIMRDGNILDDTPEIRRVVEIFLEQLKSLYRLYNSEEFKQCALFSNIDVDSSDIFIQLIGQLCALEHIESAYVIHQFLNLSYLVLRERSINQLDENKMAMVLTPGILQGLGLFGRIIPRTGHEARDTAADNQEFSLFKKLLPHVIQAPIFHQPFNRELYQEIRQPLFSSSTLSIPLSYTPVTMSSPSIEEHHRGGLLSRLKKLSVSSRSDRSEEKKHLKVSKKTEPILAPGGAPLLPAYSLLHAISASGSHSSQALNSVNSSFVVPPLPLATMSTSAPSQSQSQPHPATPRPDSKPTTPRSG